jgi:hypothetical protein
MSKKDQLNQDNKKLKKLLMKDQLRSIAKLAPRNKRKHTVKLNTQIKKNKKKLSQQILIQKIGKVELVKAVLTKQNLEKVAVVKVMLELFKTSFTVMMLI